MARIRITYDGRLVHTVEQAAVLYGLKPSSMHALLSRLRDKIQPLPEKLGEHRLYLAADLHRVMRSRPGQGYRSDLLKNEIVESASGPGGW